MNDMTTTNTTPEIKPLGDYGTCLEIHVSLPTFTRKDRNAGKQVARNNNADEKRVGVSKKLLDMPELDDLVKAKGEIYALRSAFGTSMGDNKFFVPNQNIIDCKNALDTLLHEYNSILKPAFLQAYPQGVALAQQNAENQGLGSLFDPAQYPSVYDLDSKINASAYWQELPSANPLESAHRAAQEALREEFEKNTERAQKTLMDGLWERLREPLENMSKRLDYTTDAEGKEVPTNGHFKGTIVTNVLEIVELMKYCNVSGDPRMEQVRIDLKRALTGVTYDALKNNPATRVNTKAEVDKILDKFSW